MTIDEILSLYKTKDEIEQEKIELIKNHPEKGHFTGSALVVDVNTKKFLLHYHKKFKIWVQFGGHPDEGEDDMAVTALREASEESGLMDLEFFGDKFPIDIDAHLVPAHRNMEAHYHFDFRYLLITRHAEKLVLDNPDESNQFKWFGFEEGWGMVVREVGLKRLILKASKAISEIASK